MKPISNYLICEWIPTLKVGAIHMPEVAIDYANTDSVKMFKVKAAGPGRTTRKGVFIPNEINVGDNVIIDSRVSGRPQEMGDGRFFIKNPEQAVIAVCPMEKATSASVPAIAECSTGQT
jgi:co-chaperonin GroES (HSP10)